jgi:hypothetical protein
LSAMCSSCAASARSWSARTRNSLGDSFLNRATTLNRPWRLVPLVGPNHVPTPTFSPSYRNR